MGEGDQLPFFDFEVSVMLQFLENFVQNDLKCNISEEEKNRLQPRRRLENFEKKGLLRQIWVSVMLSFCGFEVPFMLPFSKNFGHPSNRAL